MTICVFCGKDYQDFYGVHLIKNDGNVDFYCSDKCRKNALKLKRDKRKIKWTEAYKVLRAKNVEKEALRAEEEKASKKVAKK